MSLFQWVKREFLHVFPVFVFFFIAFFIINITERFLMIQAGLTPFTILDIFLAAAVIAKVLLVIDHLPGVELSRRKPLFARILWKTFVYWSITLIVRLCIRMVPFFHEPAHFAFSDFLEQVNWNLFASIQIWYLMLFFLFVTGRFLAIALGKTEMRRIFFRPNQKEVPVLRGEGLYVPFVGAIIQRKTASGQRQILIQTRAKKSDIQYNNTIEIPGGKMRAFESVFDTVRREVKEETGLEITSIAGENGKIDDPNHKDISTLIEPFCVTQMQTGPFVGLIFLCSATGEPVLATDETKEIRWIDEAELKRLIDTAPEKFYTPFLGPLKKYLRRDTHHDHVKQQ